MNKKWEICEYDQELVKKVALENNIPDIIASILVSRGITEKPRG